MNRGLLATAVALGLALVPATADAATTPKIKPARTYSSCAVLWKDYPHGVAQKKGVKDKVAGRTAPVTTFIIYKKVYDLNDKRLDRDKDKIICERR